MANIRQQWSWTAGELSRAIDRGELVLRYQPKLARCKNTGTWTIQGAEALLRWPHPAHGIIMPNDFIPVAEEAGLMLPLTDLVLQRTLEQLQFWQYRGIVLNMAVNIPTNMIGHEEFPDRLCACLATYDVEACRFVVEVTEPDAPGDVPLLIDVLGRLRHRGVQISIDGLSSGFALLKRTLRAPFSELKIGRSFVAQIDSCAEAREVVSATIDLAHWLGMTACAEGVETRESFAFLEALGCDRFQGFLISRPLNSADFEQFLRDWRWQDIQTESSAGEAEAVCAVMADGRNRQRGAAAGSST